MKNENRNNKIIMDFYINVAEALPQLLQLKSENNRQAFDNLIEKVLPEVKQYINRQLKAAQTTKTLPEGKYKVEDFIDELYIAAFENIQNLTEKDYLHHWLFSKADEILEDTIIEEDFDNAFFINIDNCTKEEWEAMEEKFTRDGDGDLVMLEELDDLSYSKQDYTLANVFIENTEKGLIEKLNAQLNEHEIHQQIDSVLFLLPFRLRSIFELSVNQLFNSKEIANIKRMAVQKVDEILAEAKNIIRSSFLKKYLND